jgi:DNA-binding GntR family transcriptional regulator
MERLSYDAKGRAVELGNHSYDSSRYAFTITLQSP